MKDFLFSSVRIVHTREKLLFLSPSLVKTYISRSAESARVKTSTDHFPLNNLNLSNIIRISKVQTGDVCSSERVRERRSYHSLNSSHCFLIVLNYHNFGISTRNADLDHWDSCQLIQNKSFLQAGRSCFALSGDVMLYEVSKCKSLGCILLDLMLQDFCISNLFECKRKKIQEQCQDCNAAQISGWNWKQICWTLEDFLS